MDKGAYWTTVHGATKSQTRLRQLTTHTQLHTVNFMYKNPTNPTAINGEKLKVFIIRYSTRERCPLSPLLFNTTLEILARVVRQEKEIKGIQSKKKNVKSCLCADDIPIYLENSKDSTTTRKTYYN